MPSVKVQSEDMDVGNGAALQILDFGPEFIVQQGQDGEYDVTLTPGMGSIKAPQKDGAPIHTDPLRTLNFVGAGVSLSRAAGGHYTVTIAGGAGSFTLAVADEVVAGEVPVQLNFSDAFEIAEKEDAPGVYNITVTAPAPDLKLAQNGTVVPGVAPSMFNFGAGFQVEQTAPGVYTIQGGGSGSALAVAKNGATVHNGPATILNFGTGFTVTAGEIEGAYNISGGGGAASFELAVAGETVPGDAPAVLSFSSAFQIEQTSPGFYTIAGGGTPLRLALGGALVSGQPATQLDFATGFTVTEKTGAPGVYEIGGMAGALAIHKEGEAVDPAPATVLNFGTGFTITPTEGGYYTIEGGSGALLVRSAGEAVNNPEDTASPDSPAQTLDFSTKFALTETTPGYYAVDLAPGVGGILVRQDGVAVDNTDPATNPDGQPDSPASHLDFKGSDFEVKETLDGYYTVALKAAVGGIKIRQQGQPVNNEVDPNPGGEPRTADSPVQFLDFNKDQFVISETSDGYYAVALSGAAGGIVVRDEETPFPVGMKSIAFKGAGVSVADGTGEQQGHFVVTIPGGAGGGVGKTVKTYQPTGSEALPATFAMDAYDNHVFTLNAPTWVFKFTAGNHPPDAQGIGEKIMATVYLKQDGEGGRTVDWSQMPSIKWDGGQSPILSLAPGKVDIIYFESIDNGATWYGAQIGGNI